MEYIRTSLSFSGEAFLADNLRCPIRGEFLCRGLDAWPKLLLLAADLLPPVGYKLARPLQPAKNQGRDRTVDQEADGSQYCDR